MSPHAVAPDSVHVWRGFKATATSYADFTGFLGKTFVPACALLQPNAGLTAYLPSMVPVNNKPAGVPDQTALMFWTSPQQYSRAFDKVAVRAYTNLHGDAYDTKLSSAQFPVEFVDAVKADQPYFLVPREADWMIGQVYHFVGGRPAGQSAAEFLGTVGKWASAYATRTSSSIDNALLVAGTEYVAFWEHGLSQDDPFAREISQLAVPCIDRMAESYRPPAGLWDDWADGIDLGVHNCINIQLSRPRR